MTPAVCAVVLAAGEGRRLRPLTDIRPKALCPVGNVPLLDRVLSLVETIGLTGPDRVAVNASWLSEQVVAHVDGRVHVSLEPGGPLGTAGGLARLRDWIAGRAVLVGNADAYLAGPRIGLLDGWGQDTVRLLGVPARPDGADAEFGRFRFAGFSLLPWSWVASLRPEPSELTPLVWRPAERAGQLEVVPYAGVFLDTGTPARYLAANLDATGGGNLVAGDAEVTGRLEKAVVGAQAVVRGTLRRSVVWPSGYVGPEEHLVNAVRVGADVTVRAD
jgi:NDP-sugar pyrophosphorylase family protein